MTSRLIEECFYQEELEEEIYNKFITVNLEGKFIIVVDPYMINLNDLKGAKSGQIVRAKRPAWGVGDLHRFIHKIEWR